jgi:hypothetical protein
MPRIPSEMMDTVFYLYPTVEAAHAGHAAGGTGIFIGHDIEGLPGREITYACSNKHVVGKLGCSVIRVNNSDGTTQVINSDPAQWTFDPHNDLAAVTFGRDPSSKIKTVPLRMFVTRDQVKDRTVGPGDEVFMVGRFVNHDGLLVNVPSVRFGHISMMPLGIRHPDGYSQESFAVEMLSRPGYSGSPVWSYRTSDQFNSAAVPPGENAGFRSPRSQHVEAQRHPNSRAPNARLAATDGGSMLTRSSGLGISRSFITLLLIRIG